MYSLLNIFCRLDVRVEPRYCTRNVFSNRIYEYKLDPRLGKTFEHVCDDQLPYPRYRLEQYEMIHICLRCLAGAILAEALKIDITGNATFAYNSAIRDGGKPPRYSELRYDTGGDTRR